MKQQLIWQLAHSDTKNGACSDWVSATVPGCVQLDMAAAYNMPLYFTGDHEDDYRWMEDKYWHYRSECLVEENERDPFLHFKGVDYEYEVQVNGELKLYHEGMFTHTDIDLTPYKGQTINVEVIVYPAPKIKDCYYERGLGNEAAHVVKPPFTYAWDWCPRFVTLGIYDEAFVEYRPAARITSLDVSYRLEEGNSTARIRIQQTSNVIADIRCTVRTEAGETVCEEVFSSQTANTELVLHNPELWWPHNHGKQPIYELTVDLLVNGQQMDSHVRKLGFRRMRLVPNDNVWAEQMLDEMKTCARPPMTLEVNGRRIFAKGSNWVPPEMCRAQMQYDRVRELLTLLKNANMNIIRMWGGGYIHPDWFYDICDELGIMVWQEFPLACTEYKDNDHYLAILEQEADAIIRQLRTHPCIAMWCGGNELFTDWSRMTPQHKAVRLLDAKTYALDQDTPFLYTSPQEGVAHGSYTMVLGNGKETLTEVYEGSYTAYTEFGCGAPSEWDYLGTFMTEDELSKPFAAPIWDKRHAVRWFDVAGVKRLTGCSDDLKDVVDAGNEAQKVMYASMFEEMRRQWPHASMAINWCYNEPWPTAAGNGLVNYPAIPRRSYYSISEALKGQKLSLRYNKIAWKPGQKMILSPWVLNDTEECISEGYAVISLIADNTEKIIGEWRYGQTQAWSNQKGEEISVVIPNVENKRFVLSIISKTHPALNAEYELFVHSNAV